MKKEKLMGTPINKEPKLPWKYGELKNEYLPEVYEEFFKPFPKEAIKEGKTPYGMDITGIISQYEVNRFNEVVGMNHWHYEYKTETEKVGNVWSSKCWIKIMIGNWKNYEDDVVVYFAQGKSSCKSRVREFAPLIIREHEGGCNNTVRYESIKGSITNAFKKCAAMFGIGHEAYEGSLDEDMMSAEEESKEAPFVKEVKIVEPKKEPLPAKEGSPEENNIYAQLLSSVNAIRGVGSLKVAKDKIDENKGNITEDQLRNVIDSLEKAEEKYGN